MKSSTQSSSKSTEPRRALSRRFLISAGILAIVGLAAASGLVISNYVQNPVAAQSEPPKKPIESDKPAEPAKTDGKPVILLTGFEPFGAGRKPNPSWESIKDLDGQDFHGYRLVCKQAQVVWGAPLQQIQGWIEQYKPDAIFSFGQGAPGAFAIETKASNQRGRIPDNRDQLPAKSKIVENGPEQFTASIDSDKLSRQLSEKGYQVRVSTNAGRYLCEECLYTLEYLRSVKKVNGSVMFCHVPPVSTRLKDRQATIEHIQSFVKDLLETWFVSEQGKKSNNESDERRQAEVKELVERYFRTWSMQDMDRYRDCFLPAATIQFIDPTDGVSTSRLGEFIESQRRYHRTSPHRTTEVPEKIDIRFDEKLARATVFWKLTAGPRTETGYDHFALIKVDGKWRIVNLVYYEAAK